MKKFFILVLAAVSVGISKCSDSVNAPQKTYNAKEILPKIFNITDDDLYEKCDKVEEDEEARWHKIEEAITDLHDAVQAQAKDHSEKLENLPDADKYKAQINVIKTALPCAKEDKVTQLLGFYKQLNQKKKNPQSSPTPKGILEELFNIKDDDLNEKCDKVDTDEQTKWTRIGQAVSDLHDAEVAQPREEQQKLENLTDGDKYKTHLHLIKTALPCANESRVTEHLAFFKQLNKQPKMRHSSSTSKGILEELFNIKDDDLNEKCDKVDTDEQFKWTRIGQAVSDFHDAVLDTLKEDKGKLEKLTDADKYKVQINVIKTALPCANEAKVNQILKFYKQKKKQNSSH